MSTTLELNELWPLCLQVYQVINPSVGPMIQQAAAESGLSDIPGWFQITLATSIDPEPISAERAKINRAPEYGSLDAMREQLRQFAETGFLTASGDGSYQVTDKARDAIKAILEAQRKKLIELDLLPEKKLEQLASLTRRLADACLAADEPQSKQAASDARARQIADDAPQIERFIRELAALNGFRDDSHISSWKANEIDGQAWEALTFVWQGNAATAEQLAEQLPYRHFAADDYEPALRSLVKRGWLERRDDGYRITKAGVAVREAPEAKTEQTFYTPWRVLSRDELDTFRNLVRELIENGQAIVVE